jgi:glutaminyl-peptide cyclotransferase
MVASSLEAIPLRVKVLSVRPHDPQAFTQGLLLHNGSLYESTGLYGRSSLRRTHPLTGEILRRVYLTPDLFGEGLERVGDRLIQLTWREQTAFVYNLNTFERMGEFTYAGEGWGLCFDDHQLIMSDGTEVITFRDPDSFAATGQIKVTLNGLPLLPRFKRLNELEWAEGWIYANVWLTDTIFRINPQNGQVTATIDASGLLSNEERLRADVLNGIAYDPEKGTFLITGKYWPKIFEVVFVPAESQSAGKL